MSEAQKPSCTANPSCTSLQTYDLCPWRYYQTRVLRVLDTGDAALRGQVWHTAAKIYIRLLANAGLRADPDLAHEALQQALIMDVCPFHLVAEVTSLWGRFIERFRLDLDAYVGNEDRQDDPEYVWIPDLVYCREDEVEIPDFKTFHVGLTEAQAREDFQARFYSWRASVLWPGFARYRFTFVFVRLNQQVSVTFTNNELAAFGEHVARLNASRLRALARLQAEGEAALRWAFPPRPGSLCQYCTVACPRTEDARREPVRLQAREDAERIAGDILALEATLKARKAALKGYCEVEGAVRTSDMEFANRSRVETSFPAVAVIAHLLDQKLKPDQTYTADEVAGMVLEAVPDLGWSKTALKWVLKKHPALLAAGDEKTTWAFGSKKANETELQDA